MKKFGSFILVLFFSSSLCFGQPFIPFLDHGVYGYADLDGKQVIKPQFDEINWFDSIGLADVRIGNYWSKINMKGNLLFPFGTEHPVQFTPVFSTNSSLSNFTTEGEDTLRNLRVVEVNPDQFLLVHLANGHFSDLISSKDWSRLEVNQKKEIRVNYFHGVLTYKVSDSLYQVIDTNLNILLKTNEAPFFLNHHLIATKENGHALLFDFQNLKKTPLPFLDIRQAINDSLFIVTNPAPVLKNSNRWDPTVKGLFHLKDGVILETKYPNLHYSMGDLLTEYVEKQGSRFIDFKGHPIDTNIYPAIDGRCDSFYLVHTSDHKMLVLDNQGKPKSKLYDKIVRIGCKFFNFNVGKFAGILDSTYKELVRVEADEVYYSFSGEPYIIKRNSKYGLNKANGEVILPPIYDEFQGPSNSLYVTVKLNGKVGMFRRDGVAIFQPVYQDIDGIGADGKTYYATKLNNLYTLYDDQFNIIDDSIVGHVTLREVNITRTGGLTYLKDPHGRLITSPAEKYNGSVVFTDTSWIHIITREDHIEIINDEGQIITNDSIRLEKNNLKRSYDGGLFGVTVRNKQGVINHRLKWILPLSDQDIIAVTAGLIITKKGGKYYFYNATGQLLHIDAFQSIAADKSEKYWRVELNHKFGYLNSMNGQIAIPIIYDQTTQFDDFLSVVISGKNDGSKTSSLVDTSGNVILNTSYDSLYVLDEIESYRRYMAVDKGKIGIIDIDGRMVIPIEYDNLTPFADSLFFASHSESEGWKLINRNNQVVFSGQQFPDELFIRLPDNHFLFTIQGQGVIVDEEGRKIKSIDATYFRKIPEGVNNIQFIEAMEDGHKFLINANTFVEYRR